MYLRDALHQVLSAQRSGRLEPGKLKMVNQVPGVPRRDKRGASLILASMLYPISNLYLFWTTCAIASCLPTITDFPSGSWGIFVGMFIGDLGARSQLSATRAGCERPNVLDRVCCERPNVLDRV